MNDGYMGYIWMYDGYRGCISGCMIGMWGYMWMYDRNIWMYDGYMWMQNVYIVACVVV